MSLRKKAEGAPCTVNIAQVCKDDGTTTVLAHIRQGTGIGQKPDDLSAVIACYQCHDAIDRRVKAPEGFEADRWWYLFRALVRTWTHWARNHPVELIKHIWRINKA